MFLLSPPSLSGPATSEISSAGTDLRQQIVDRLNNAEEATEGEAQADEHEDEEVEVLDEREAAVHEVDLALLDQAVPSSSVGNREEFEQHARRLKEIRESQTAPLRTKAQIRAANIEDIRGQREQQQRSAETREHLLVLLIQQQNDQFRQQLEYAMKRDEEREERLKREEEMRRVELAVQRDDLELRRSQFQLELARLRELPQDRSSL